MKKKSSWCGILVLLMCVNVGGGSPAQPVRPRIEKLGPFQNFVEGQEFKGKERALVIVAGSGRSYMALYVFDAHGNCVAHDDLGSPFSRDELAAEWHPQKNERYSYEIRNLGLSQNAYKLVVK